ncbi:HNH endonuclease signature motif containing protein, partial [Rhizobium johnstonii]
QRRAIALRDGGCIIPGCGTPAAWTEIHHVTEYAKGGPTHTDNGVLLCWYHHRFLDRIGWKIRMNHGVPEVMAPGWFDASLRWRAVTTSP